MCEMDGKRKKKKKPEVHESFLYPSLTSDIIEYVRNEAILRFVR